MDQHHTHRGEQMTFKYKGACASFQKDMLHEFLIVTNYNLLKLPPPFADFWAKFYTLPRVDGGKKQDPHWFLCPIPPWPVKMT